jgi:hypothetical protein
MSVCVVAEYPWRAIKQLVGTNGPPSVIMCSDTRLCVGPAHLAVPLSKQYGFSRNLAVCYTSSNVEITTRALDECAGTSNVKRLGASLRDLHADYGGVTQLIAVVWTTGHPRILEVMPPSYVPKPRSGIVGIGSLAVLRRFRELFLEDPSSYCPLEVTPEMLSGLSKALGYPVTLDDFGSRFPIEQAMVNIATALSEAIESVNDRTVALPLQITKINKEGYTPFYVYDPNRARWLTTTKDDLVLLDPPLFV